jgi:hypothetical protein
VISYADGTQLKQYDVETGAGLAPLPIALGDANSRWAASLFGRYVVFEGADGKLHLLDRLKNNQPALPGIDVYANPGNLSVTDTGLIAFDDNSNGPGVVYNSITKTFIDTGLAANNGHRQTELSGDGKFLAATCISDCEVDDGSGDSDPYLQDLTTRMDLGPIGDDNDSDEEHPCVNGNGFLVGYDRGNPAGGDDHDVFIYDRTANDFLDLPGLNDATTDDTYCALSPGGTYIAFMNDNANFKLYDRTTSSFISLPALPFQSGSFSNSILSAPFAICAGKQASLVGTPAADTLRGSSKADIFTGLGGADKLIGLGGNDLICGGAGGDRLLGGKGRDRLLGGPGRDRLRGGPGRDKLIGGPGNDLQRQ